PTLVNSAIHWPAAALSDCTVCPSLPTPYPSPAAALATSTAISAANTRNPVRARQTAVIACLLGRLPRGVRPSRPIGFGHPNHRPRRRPSPLISIDRLVGGTRARPVDVNRDARRMCGRLDQVEVQRGGQILEQ